MQVGSLVANDGSIGYGISVGGVPIGDDQFVDSFMDGKTMEMLSKITNVSEKLRSMHLQSLHVVTYYCLSPLFQYWLRHF